MSESFWEWGHAPDKILQQTKDNHITSRLESDVQNIVTKVAGAITYEDWAPEFEAVSRLLYFFVTRSGGQQTLGEEYTDLQVVVSRAASVGSAAATAAAGGAAAAATAAAAAVASAAAPADPPPAVSPAARAPQEQRHGERDDRL